MKARNTFKLGGREYCSRWIRLVVVYIEGLEVQDLPCLHVLCFLFKLTRLLASVRGGLSLQPPAHNISKDEGTVHDTSTKPNAKSTGSFCGVYYSALV